MDESMNMVSQDGFPTIEEYEAKGEEALQSQPVQLPLLELESLTFSYQSSVDRLKEEAKRLKQQLDDAVNNDSIYHEKAEAVRALKKEADSVKVQILKQPHMMQLENQLKEVKAEAKAKQSGVSDYALEFAKLSGATQIEKDGVVYEIVTVAKLKKVQQ